MSWQSHYEYELRWNTMNGWPGHGEPTCIRCGRSLDRCACKEKIAKGMIWDEEKRAYIPSDITGMKWNPIMFRYETKGAK